MKKDPQNNPIIELKKKQKTIALQTAKEQILASNITEKTSVFDHRYGCVIFGRLFKKGTHLTFEQRNI